MRNVHTVKLCRKLVEHVFNHQYRYYSKSHRNQREGTEVVVDGSRGNVRLRKPKCFNLIVKRLARLAHASGERPKLRKEAVYAILKKA